MSERALREQIEQVSHAVRDARRELERLAQPDTEARELEAMAQRVAQLTAQREALREQGEAMLARLRALRDERDGLERRLAIARRDVVRLTPEPPPVYSEDTGLSSDFPWLKVFRFSLVIWFLYWAMGGCR